MRWQSPVQSHLIHLNRARFQTCTFLREDTPAKKKLSPADFLTMQSPQSSTSSEPVTSARSEETKETLQKTEEDEINFDDPEERAKQERIAKQAKEADAKRF